MIYPIWLKNYPNIKFIFLTFVKCVSCVLVIMGKTWGHAIFGANLYFQQWTAIGSSHDDGDSKKDSIHTITFNVEDYVRNYRTTNKNQEGSLSKKTIVLLNTPYEANSDHHQP